MMASALIARLFGKGTPPQQPQPDLNMPAWVKALGVPVTYANLPQGVMGETTPPSLIDRLRGRGPSIQISRKEGLDIPTLMHEMEHAHQLQGGASVPLSQTLQWLLTKAVNYDPRLKPGLRGRVDPYIKAPYEQAAYRVGSQAAARADAETMARIKERWDQLKQAQRRKAYQQMQAVK